MPKILWCFCSRCCCLLDTGMLKHTAKILSRVCPCIEEWYRDVSWGWHISNCDSVVAGNTPKQHMCAINKMLENAEWENDHNHQNRRHPIKDWWNWNTNCIVKWNNNVGWFDCRLEEVNGFACRKHYFVHSEEGFWWLVGNGFLSSFLPLV